MPSGSGVCPLGPSISICTFDHGMLNHYERTHSDEPIAQFISKNLSTSLEVLDGLEDCIICIDLMGIQFLFFRSNRRFSSRIIIALSSAFRIGLPSACRILFTAGCRLAYFQAFDLLRNRFV